MNPGKSALMIIASFYPHLGGAEKQALELSRALQRNGWRVSVLTRRLPGLAASEEVEGVPVRRLWAPGHGFLNSAAFMASCFFHMLAHRREFAVAHVHMASSHAVAAALAGRLLGKPVFVKLAASRSYGEILFSGTNLPGRIKLRLLQALAPRLLAINGEMETEVKNSALRRLQLSHFRNGVDTAAYTPAPPQRKAQARTELGLGAGPVFLFAGRITGQKNLRAFLPQWAQAARNHPQARLVLAGEGDETPALRADAGKLGAAAQVVFPGPVRDMRPWYDAANVFVLPSLAEGVSNAMLEAMACGLPVLASRVGGAADAVRDGENGFLFEPQDDAAMLRKTAALLDNPQLAGQMGLRARETAVARYSLDAVARELAGLYETALQGR